MCLSGSVFENRAFDDVFYRQPNIVYSKFSYEFKKYNRR